MELAGHLQDLERQFWKGSAEFYRHNLTDKSLMVFAEPVGILTRGEIVEAIEASPRWADIRFENLHVVQLTDDVAIVSYKASARREGEGAHYSTLASSVYVNKDGSWKLAFHQQTPGGEA